MAGTELTRRQHDRKGDTYASDMTGAEWALTAPLMPRPKTTGRLRRYGGLWWGSHILLSFERAWLPLSRKATATGVSHRRAIGPSAMATARHFRLSPEFVNDMVKLKRATGGLLPKVRKIRNRSGG